jgi:hypothetical protein
MREISILFSHRLITEFMQAADVFEPFPEIYGNLGLTKSTHSQPLYAENS